MNPLRFFSRNPAVKIGVHTRPRVYRSAPSFLVFLPVLLAAGALFVGCGHKEGDGHDHGGGHRPGHGEESPSGASFQAGSGVRLTDETRQNLGVEIADLTARRLPNHVRLTVQVFGE